MGGLGFVIAVGSSWKDGSFPQIFLPETAGRPLGDLRKGLWYVIFVCFLILIMKLPGLS